MDLVSIIIPTYKRSLRLRSALESISKQTYKNIEIIVVDDNGLGSKYDDETKSVVDDFSIFFDNLIFVKNKKNMGGGGARNEGIKVANGRFITFLDDDDLYLPNKVELQVKKFEESNCQNLAFVYCQMTLFDDTSGAKLSQTKNYYSGNEVPFKENMKGCIAGTPTILASKAALKSINGFREFKSGQDWALILDLLVAGYEIDFLPESLVSVFVSSRERISNSPGKVESLEVELKFLKDEVIKGLHDKKLIRTIYYYHYLQLCNALKFKKKSKAISYYFKMCSYGFRLADSIKFFFGLIFGEKSTAYIRSKIQKR